MKRNPISNSSQIKSIGYDPTTKTLEVEFKSNGALYQYHDVPQSAYQEFSKAGSLGQHFNQKIKGNYKGKKL